MTTLPAPHNADLIDTVATIAIEAPPSPTLIRWTDNSITFEFDRSVWETEEDRAKALDLIRRCAEKFLEKYPGKDDEE